MPWYWILLILSAIVSPFEAMYAVNRARRNREEAERKRREAAVAQNGAAAPADETERPSR